MAYTIAELAERWNCHPKTIRRLIRARKLTAFRVGREWRVPAESVAAYERQAARHA